MAEIILAALLPIGGGVGSLAAFLAIATHPTAKPETPFFIATAGVGTLLAGVAWGAWLNTG